MTIYTRSPYKVSATGTINQAAKIELFIYNAPASVPATPTRVLTKLIPSSTATTVYFNVSPYIREYIDHILFTELTTVGAILNSEYAKCRMKVYVNNVLLSTTDFNCLDGYGYNSDGWNFANTTPTALLTEGEYLISETTSGSLYFDTLNDGLTYTASWLDPTTGSLLDDAFFTNGIIKIPYVTPDCYAEGGAVLKITQGATLITEYTFRTFCGGKYASYNCDFVNRYGVWQRLTLFGAARKSITTESVEYNFMNRAANYNPVIANRQEINKNGYSSLRLNTGLVNEFYADVIQQLMLSERVIINDEPVIVTTKSSELPIHVNTKQINYPLEFKYANNLINTGI